MLFFSHSRRIWVAYAIISFFLFGVLSWFSWTTMRLDAQRQQDQMRIEQARQEAEWRERIGYALWRMDWMLTPLVAQEAARTHWMYQPFVDGEESSREGFGKLTGVEGIATGDSSRSSTPRHPTPLPSPLLIQPSPFVILHFQIDQDGTVSSPQSPVEPDRQLAMTCGVSESNLASNQARLAEIARDCEFQPMWEACSDRKLPEIATNDLTWLLAGSSSLNPSAPGATSTQWNAPAQLLGNRSAVQSQGEQAWVGASDDQLNKLAVGYDRREASANEYALSQWQMNRMQPSPSNEPRVTEGVMRPLWIGDRLILARRVDNSGKGSIQGCWLDWEAIRKSLLEGVADIVPGAQLIPYQHDHEPEHSRALATLPVKLILPVQDANAPRATGGNPSNQPTASLGLLPSRPVSLALAGAWGGFLLAAASTAWLILGVVQLSERRAAFASAVTHELRTPLTTFRLYSEMLNSKMLTNESQRETYTAGLVSESDRLCRLVENVLQFARLERQTPVVRREVVTVADLIERILPRCQRRASAAGMNLENQINDATLSDCLETSVEAIDQIVFNLVDNACKYASNSSNRSIQLDANRDGNWLVLSVRDFGPGIDRSMLKRLFRPFSRSAEETAGTAAGVGIGLALAQQLAKHLGGRLSYRPADPGCQFDLRLKSVVNDHP